MFEVLLFVSINGFRCFSHMQLTHVYIHAYRQHTVTDTIYTACSLKTCDLNMLRVLIMEMYCLKDLTFYIATYLETVTYSFEAYL